MRLGFFGGSFNPPSNIHMLLARDIIRNYNLDKLFFVPVGNYYIKEDLINASHRVNMLKIATENENKIEVEEIVADKEDMLYAIDTFRLIKEKYKNDEVFFIMGSDNFRKMPTWKNYDELINNYNIIVIERERKELRQPIRKNNIYEFIPDNLTQMDSTKIREMIKNKEALTEYLNEDVLNYIKINNLYCN